MSLITRCPHCSTRYKVVPDQLRLASGWVRCGQCNQMFDGRAHLLTEEPVQPAQASRPPSAPEPLASPQTRAPTKPAPSPVFQAAEPGPEPEAEPTALAQTPAAFLADAGSGAQGDGPPATDGPEQPAPAFDSALESIFDAEPPEPVLPAQPDAWGAAPLAVAEPGPEPEPEPEPEPAAAAALAQIPAAFLADVGSGAQGDDPPATDGPEQPAPAFDSALESIFDAEPSAPVLPDLPDAWAAADPEPSLDGLSAHDPWGELAPAAEPASLPELSEPSASDPVLEFPTDSGLDFFAHEGAAAAVAPGAGHAFDVLGSDPGFELSLPPEDAPFSASLPLDSAPGHDLNLEPGLLDAPPETALGDAWANEPLPEQSPALADGPQPIPPVPMPEPDDSVQLSFVARAERRAFWRSPVMRVLLWLAAGVLGLGLAGQLAVQNRDWLAARHPGLAKPLNRLCQPLGCAVQPWRGADAVVIDNSSFGRAGPSSFRFVLSLRNTARLPVATPALELILTDENQQTLLRRVVLPHELGMPDTLNARSEFEARSLITLAHAARPEAVVNYRLVAFYP